MSTAGARLALLSGLAPGASAAEHLKRIAGAAGLSAGALLVAYSGLASGTAAQHLLTDSAVEPEVVVQQVVSGGGGGGAMASLVERAQRVAADELQDISRDLIRRNNEVIVAAFMALLTKGHIR